MREKARLSWVRTTTLARGHDARIALSTAAQRAGQGMSGGNVMALTWCLLTSASKLIQTSTCSLSATGASVEAAIRHPQRRRSLSGYFGVERWGSEEHGGLDRF